MVGYNSRSLVLANENNFKQFLKRFSFIGQTSIISEPNSLTVTASCLRNKVNELNNPEEYLDLNSDDLRGRAMYLRAESKKNLRETIDFSAMAPI